MEFKGVVEWAVALKGITEAMDQAVRNSVRQGALLEKQAVRSAFSGPPRWDHRQHPVRHEERSGGPGILTGRLMRSVGYLPIERRGYGHYSTLLKARRVYANKVESQYPYFVPKVRESYPAVQRIFERNYAGALTKSAGRIATRAI